MKRELIIHRVILMLIIAYGLSPKVETQRYDAVRSYPVAAKEERTDWHHVLIGENYNVTAEFLARTRYNMGSGKYGPNMIVADNFYNAVERKTHVRSLIVRDVDDPADVRLGRAPGVHPNQVDFTARLEPYRIVGNIGFEGFSENGFGGYFAALRGAVLTERTGILYLATATGKPGRTRHGGNYSYDRLVDHVALTRDGTLDVGFDTDPLQRPRYTAKVRGNLIVEGAVYAQRCIELPVQQLKEELEK